MAAPLIYQIHLTRCDIIDVLPVAGSVDGQRGSMDEFAVQVPQDNRLGVVGEE